MTAEWQPIETAPKDEEPILLFDGFGEVRIGWLMNHRHPESGYECSYGCDCSHPETVYKPTHWMPLPEPPERS